METIITHKSGSGSRQHQHVILPDEPHLQSFAALVLLTHQYILLDPEANPEISWKIYKRRRKQVLREHLAKYGKYICTYCNRSDLELYPTEKEKQVTIDHIVPISRGGSYTSKKNMAVCCHKCNGNKGNLLKHDFLRGLDAFLDIVNS
jgi:HNH endonuclease